jgi:hypothetical protein
MKVNSLYEELHKFILWNVAPCSLADTDQYFGTAYCLHHQLL